MSKASVVQIMNQIKRLNVSIFNWPHLSFYVYAMAFDNSRTAREKRTEDADEKDQGKGSNARNALKVRMQEFSQSKE